jgi:hypothetical protein
MKEIKLWQISQKGENELPVVPLQNVNQTQTEEQLEEIIVKYPDLLFDGLKLVGRQTDTAGGPLDLLGVDSAGRLVVFELKRGTLTREAIAQVIDYASFLEEMEPGELSQHISDRSGRFGIEKIEDFSAWYNEQYQKSIYEIQKPKMILVGLGADDRTRRMVSFLSNNDIDISLITFYGFEQDGKTYLAKQIEVLAKPSKDLSSLTKKDRLELLRERVRRVGIESFYENVAGFFRDQLSAYEWPNVGGYSYYLTDFKEDGSPTNLVYLSLYVNENKLGKAEIRIQERAIEAARDAFDEFCRSLKDKVIKRPAGGAEVWISSLSEWQKMTDDFMKLCPSIIEGWKERREKLSVSS